jgi:transcription factor E
MPAKKGKDDRVKGLLSQLFLEVAGEEAVQLIDLLFGKRPVNEFLVAKKLKLTINQVRNLLYRLGDEGLVSFTRKKDAKKGGWYIYFWTIELEKSLVKLEERLKEKKVKLGEQIEQKKTKQFYRCEECDFDFTEEEALLKDFHCEECGELMILKDTSLEVEEAEASLVQVNDLIDPVAEELAALRAKGAKARARFDAAEAKKKAAERKKRAAIRKRAKTLEEKKSGKKIVKKVVKKKVKKKAKKNASASKKKPSKKSVKGKK